jgi:hypothetical protein
VGAGQRTEVPKRVRVAQPEVALGVAGPHQRLPPDRGKAGRHARHRPTHHSGQLEKAVAVEAVLQEDGRVAGQIAVLLGEDALAGLHGGGADGAPGVV